MKRKNEIQKKVVFTKEELLTIIDAVECFLFEEEYLSLKSSIISKCRELIKSSE